MKIARLGQVNLSAPIEGTELARPTDTVDLEGPSWIKLFSIALAIGGVLYVVSRSRQPSYGPDALTLLARDKRRMEQRRRSP